MISRVSGSLNASSPPQTSAENDMMMGIILVMLINLPKMKLLMMAASLQVPFSTPNAVALRTEISTAYQNKKNGLNKNKNSCYLCMEKNDFIQTSCSAFRHTFNYNARYKFSNFTFWRLDRAPLWSPQCRSTRLRRLRRRDTGTWW